MERRLHKYIRVENEGISNVQNERSVFVLTMKHANIIIDQYRIIDVHFSLFKYFFINFLFEKFVLMF